MQAAARIALGALSVMLAAGCRTAARMIEEPRVDLEMPEGGNRGFLVGTPPPPAEGRKTTRQMIETELEVPPFGRAQPPPTEAGTPRRGSPTGVPRRESARPTEAGAQPAVEPEALAAEEAPAPGTEEPSAREPVGVYTK